MRRLVARLTASALLLSLPTALSAHASAQATTDITPPAVGSCYEMTLQEVKGASNANPPVPCTDRHTTMTFNVVEFPEPPDWNDEDTYAPEVYDQCNPAWVDVLGGTPKRITRSSYTYYWLLPTPAQRDAGAAWVRCELVLSAGGSLAKLPEQVELGALPLPDAVARCREGERADYRVTVCSRAHQYRASYSFRLPWSRWRGADASQKFSYRECNERAPGHFHYQWPSSRYWWRLGFRYAICLPKTTN